MSPTADETVQDQPGATAAASAAMEAEGAPAQTGDATAGSQDGANVGTETADDAGDAPPEKTQAEHNAEAAAAIQKRLDDQAAAAAGQASDTASDDGAQSNLGAVIVETDKPTVGDAQPETEEQAAARAAAAPRRAPAFEEEPDDVPPAGSPIGEEIMQRLRYFENLVDHQATHIAALGGVLTRHGVAPPALPHFPQLKSRLGNYNPNNRT